ncbi:MAG: phosphoglucosamine mutase [candidate division KSB1 bacterium]|nr:phosphoglucosamine mutase [candidate division KSB1 bacterium]MDZ7346137.1 phosphoglucosamine mutase [candidate division KSB1 bacterium]
MTQLKNLMVSVSGIRGIVGDGLTPEAALQLAQAYGSEFGPGKIVLARDSRVTGPMLKHAVIAGLMAVGCDVVDLDLAATPTAELITERPEHAGGIIITASHNPKEWNALKLLAPDGLFLRPDQGQKVIDRVYKSNFSFVPWNRIGRYYTYNDAAGEHVSRILELPIIDAERIRGKKFKVVVDCCNGAGEAVLPKLFEAFGCSVTWLNREANGLFPRNPEPVPENLTELSEAVRRSRADFGLAVDPDVDRLALVDEKGIPLGEEYTLVLAVRFVLSKTPGDVVVNASTTRAIDDVAAPYGRVHRTPVGEIHVAVKAQQIGAVMAGEGNGGVMYPELHIGRDAPMGIALILQYLAESGKRLSELKAEVPHYVMIKDKIELGFGVDAKAVVERLKEQLANENLNTIDGLKVIYQDSWVHIRASNTEPIIRIIAEAPTQEKTVELIEHYKAAVVQLTN